MSEPLIPEARTVSPARVRFVAFLGKLASMAVPPMLIVGVIGLAVFGIVKCSQGNNERLAAECASYAARLDRVERVVREGAGLRAYVQDPSSKILWEHRFPSTHFATITYFTDVPEGAPIRIISSARLEPNEQCQQTIEVHIRSAHDIE